MELQTDHRSSIEADNVGDHRDLPIYEILTQPGVSLIMPSEQHQDFIDGRTVHSEFLTTRQGDSRSSESPHNGTTYARVFANDIAEPFLKLEDLRFPVGSVIVREKLAAPASDTPDLIAAMIKRDREFSPETNGWEFVVIDRNFTRVKTRQTTGNCAACHVQASKSDLVYKTYLR